MLLAWMRYILICRRNSWFYYRVSDKISKGSFFAIVVAILVPALIWTVIMYFGSPATGNFWVFRPADNSSDNELISVFQPIPDEIRHKAKPIQIVMVLLILLQLLLTLFFYIRICYDSFMSTMNVNLKRDRNHEKETENDSTIKRRENIEMEKVHQNDTYSQRTKRFHTTDEQCSGNSKEKVVSKKHAQHIQSKNHNLAVQKLTCTKPISDDIDAITDLPDEDIGSSTTSKQKPNSISAVSTTNLMNSNSEKESKQAISKEKNTEKKDKKRKNKFFLPTANDYKNFGPAAGAYKVNIPLTKVVLCVSERDIACTTSLTCQIICLLLTHALMVYCFSVSGKKISLSRYESTCICFEIASIINALVDSVVSLLFSSSFREAAFKTVFPPKSHHFKSNIKIQNKH